MRIVRHLGLWSDCMIGFEVTFKGEETAGTFERIMLVKKIEKKENIDEMW